VGGVMVSRATLHNEDQLRAKDVRVGDTVWIRRAGDVIPEILRVDPEQRPKASRPYEMPTHCPVCETPVAREKSAIICPNPACPAKSVERFLHYCSRHAMDIRGLGDQIVARFFELGYLKSLADIYRLKDRREELVELDGLGEKSIEKILESIENSKSQDTARFLFALGIDLIGEKTAEDLVAATGSLKKLFSLNEDQLVAIPQVGPETVRVIRAAAENATLQAEIRELGKLGVQGATRQDTVHARAVAEGPLAGLTFVITGTLSQPREHFRDLLKAQGATVTDAVSKSTSCLLAGEKAGSKLKKAESLGVRVISEAELQKFLASGFPADFG
jgi:DNA ligase (NAD+)